MMKLGPTQHGECIPETAEKGVLALKNIDSPVRENLGGLLLTLLKETIS